MSILKMKIAKAREIYERKNAKGRTSKRLSLKIETLKVKQKKSIELSSHQMSPVSTTSNESLQTIRGVTSCKNIMKNYSKALTKFAASDLAQPYLAVIVQKYSINLQYFQEFIRKKRNGVNCIRSLRELLLVEEGDDERLAAIKNIFKEISIIFLKQFSVNWIFNSKICDKIIHLKYRFKILRRVQNPIYFTYLEEFSKKSSRSGANQKNKAKI